MNGRGLQQPRHPSLDNLRRSSAANSNSAARSYPQLPNHNNDHFLLDDYHHQHSRSLFHIISGLICAAAAFWCFVGLILLLSVLYMVCRPFSQSLYRRLAASMGAASFLDAISLLLPNQTIFVTGDSDMPSPVGTSLLVCNDLVDSDGTDWWSIFMLGRSVGLRGSVKVFLRNECLGLQPQKQRTHSSSLSSTSLVDADKTVTFSTRLPTNGANGGNSNGANHPTHHSSSAHHSTTTTTGRKATVWVTMCAQMLHTLLDFPVLSNENQYIEEREDLFSLLKSFAETNTQTPVHLLLFPEGWSILNGGGADKRAVLRKSLDFAIREGRPQLKHLLLPRTTGFNASLESLRESNPVVYDVTLATTKSTTACNNTATTTTTSRDLSIRSLWNSLRQPNQQIHMRIKRYSMEEVLQDAKWLDKQWAEKDYLLTQFQRHGSLYPDYSRFSVRHRIFETRNYVAVESSVLSLLRLLILPTFCPILLFLSIPLFWTVFWVWILYKAYMIVMGENTGGGPSSRINGGGGGGEGSIPTPNSRAGTPFVPATPFGSPSLGINWRDMMGK